MLDRLSRLGAETVAPSAQQAAKQSTESPKEELPDWLSSLPSVEAGVREAPPDQVRQPASEPETPPAKEAAKPSAASTPAFIADEGALPSGDVNAVFPMEMPDWLSTLGPTEKERPSTAAAEEGDEELAPAELPSWVQAMRPVEAVVPEELTGEDVTQVATKAGPLAGLHGILPTQADIGVPRKPQAHAIKLQVSEGQQANAALLEKMLAAEAEPRPLTSPSLVLSQRILRWVIAILLALIVTLPVLAKTQLAPTTSYYPKEIEATVRTINALNAEGTVLFVFDYEAGLSGELEAVAAPVVDHVMLNGTRLAIMSTTPSGPLLAERFLQNTQAGHNYQRGQNYVNLGYVPGGPSGIQGFVTSPTTVIRLVVAGQSIWDTPPLQGVRNLSDFKALFVLTDDAETARTWIEQVGPAIGNVPLIMVTSAQAEPMIRPYLDSGQITGLVSGLAGGAVYERVNGRFGLVRQYWDAYSLGLFLAEVMIIVGGLWSLMTAWQARHARPADEE